MKAGGKGGNQADEHVLYGRTQAARAKFRSVLLSLIAGQKSNRSPFLRLPGSHSRERIIYQSVSGGANVAAENRGESFSRTGKVGSDFSSNPGPEAVSS